MISFILPATDKTKVKTLEASLNQLGTPFELIPIYNSTSFFDAWRQGVAKAKGEYLCFTHQDTEFYYIPDLDKEFTKGVGLCGAAGSREIDKTEPWWFSMRRLQSNLLSGQVYHNSWDAKGLSNYGDYGEVKILDGVCLITRKERLLKVGIPNKDWCTWDYYDHVLSLDYQKKGYKLKTIPVVMVHASAGGNRRESFYTAEKEFIKEYL